ESSCSPHAPCRYPFDGCIYYGRLLYNRTTTDADADAAVTLGCLTVTLHKSRAFHVLLHRGGGATRVLLLLGEDVPYAARSLSLVSVGPRPRAAGPANSELLYKIVVAGRRRASGELARSDGHGLVAELRPKAFLFVPVASWGSSGTVSITVHM
uniref:Uncharacterized protein n=1 Tax=Oryza brachyantha TaxID=4533 RepID=J3M4Q3_ORYBR